MDAEAFLSAQLWLRPLPAEAWPKTTRVPTPGDQAGRSSKPAGAVAAAGADKSCDGKRCGVILAKATCCFLLEDRPSAPAAGVNRSSNNSTEARNTSGRRGDSPRSRRRPRPLLFSTRCSTATAAATNENNASRNSTNSKDNLGPGDKRSSQTSCVGGNPQEAERGRGTLHYSSCCYGFERDNSGMVRVAGKDQQKERVRPTATAATTLTATCVEPAPVRLKQEFSFGVAIARGSPHPPQRRTGNNAAGGIGEGGGIEVSGSRPDESDGACHPSAEEQGGGGFLLLQVDGKVYEAEHTLIRSIAYPLGGGRTGCSGKSGATRSGRQEESRQQKTSPMQGATATDTTAASRRGRDRGAGGAKGPSAAGAIGAAPARQSPLASSTAEVAVAAGRKRSIDTSNGDGAAGTAAVGRAGGGGHGTVAGSSNEERPERVGKRGRVDTGGDVAGAAGAVGRRGLADAAAAEAAAEKKQAQERSHDGDGGMEAGMPFCGLFFPGVMIKFWVPRRNKSSPAVAAGGGTRADDVARMQGVVNDMMAGLSPTPRFHRPSSLVGMARQQLDDQVRLGVAEGQDTGFQRRCEAWDEFVYGSHVLLRQRSGPSDCRLRQRASHLPRKRGGGGNAGGPKLSPSAARCSEEWMGDVGAPALSGLSGIGDEDAGFEGGGLSDVGQARALTSLAECFSAARLPPPSKLAVQRRLEDEAICAGRELEDALDRAFPLDLSQGADEQTRASAVSELETSLHRVQAARKAVLALALLPASEMLDESGGSA